MEKILFALQNDKLVSIDEVEKGKNCNCVCPCCKQPLVAKQGKIKVHHFAHANGESCEHGYETSLHLLAKEILSTTKEIVLPKIEIGGYVKIKVEESKTIKINEVKLEKAINDIRPDVILSTDEGDICIEIYVTHKVDDVKKAKIEKANLNTIEIDLSEKKTVTNYDELKSILLEENQLKKWVYNVKLEKEKKKYLINRSINYCIYNSGYGFDPIYCITHCDKSINLEGDDLYCLEAEKVNNAKEEDGSEVFCSVCGLQLELKYGQYGAYYKCECCGKTENAPRYNRKCKKCGEVLGLKKNHSWPYKKFYGCTNYPLCDYTESYNF